MLFIPTVPVKSEFTKNNEQCLECWAMLGNVFDQLDML